jgi:hypothetical protein
MQPIIYDIFYIWMNLVTMSSLEAAFELMVKM